MGTSSLPSHNRLSAVESISTEFDFQDSVSFLLESQSPFGC